MLDINPCEIKPYGDTLNDGKVQVSFTLPVTYGPKSREAAKRICKKMGMEEIDIVEMKDLKEGFCFFIAYGKVDYFVDTTQIQASGATAEVMDFYQVNEFIEERLGREIVVVGACTGSDAHTVGLDAIMNMKGFAGEYGLERYPWFTTYNLGSQVTNEELIMKAVEVKADAILVSQVVTQRDVHIRNLTELVELLEAEGLREQFLVIIGGPRINNELAMELGFDAGFGSGTIPPEVATYIVEQVAE